MATDKNNKANTYSPYKGSPSSGGKSKAQTKDVKEGKIELNEQEEIIDKYIEDNDTDAPAEHLIKNPNRNPIKENIDNGKYN